MRVDGGGSYDPDGRIASWRWDFDDLDAPVMAATAERSYDAPGVHSAQLTVTDASGAANGTARAAVAIRVNHPPVAEAGAETFTDSLYVTLDGSGSTDPENHTLTYAWTQVDDLGDPVLSGPDKVTLSNASAQKPTFAAPPTGPVTLHFHLVVTDQFGLASTFDAVDIAVDANAAPVADAGPDQGGIKAGQVVTLDGSFLRAYWTLKSINSTGTTWPISWNVKDTSPAMQTGRSPHVAQGVPNPPPGFCHLAVMPVAIVLPFQPHCPPTAKSMRDWAETQ